MKTCRLKVYPDQKIVMSLPHSVPNEWAESFLTEKGSWIESKLQSFKKTVGYASSHIVAENAQSSRDTISLTGARTMVEELSKRLPKVEWGEF